MSGSSLFLPAVLVALLIGAVLIIIALVCGLLKMRYVKCMKLTHPYILADGGSRGSPALMTRLPELSSPCSTVCSHESLSQ